MAGYEAAFKYKLIYIMVIHDADHDGYLKIGDATLASSLGPSQLPPNCELLNTATHERIKQYTKTALTSYELLYTELALRFTKMADGTSMPNPFRDEDIHDVLVIHASGFQILTAIRNGMPLIWKPRSMQSKHIKKGVLFFRLLKKYVRLQNLDIASRKRLNFGRNKRRLWSAQFKSFIPMTECFGIAKCGLGKRFLLMS